jgi:bifunctional ADP-heptose synthase (sugar kinase/adenylyltransferase)
LGQSTKTPNVVGQFLREERFPGGAVAVANHLAGFCDRVELIAMVGRDAPSRRWIGEHLRPEVQWRPLVRPDAPTVVKRQYRDSYLGLPLFEVDYLDDAPLDAARRAELVDMLAAALPAADLVLVADQGHGMLDDHTIPLLCDTARYLAVTTPASAANLGFHTISKYRRADHLTLAEQDLRLDRRSRCGNAEQMLVEIADRLQAREATLTVGNKGCVCYRPGQGLVTAPALATRVVDRLGAGAAAFAVTGLAAALDFPLDQLAFLSNVAGAQAVAVVGHSRFLDEGSFGRHVESLLK